MRTPTSATSPRRHVLHTDAAMAAAVLLLGLFLTGTGGSIAQRWRSSSARNQSLGFEDQLGIVANTAGLILTVWWVLSLSIALAAALLERSGKTRAASTAGKFAPAFMRRLAVGAVGFQLLTAPLAAAATTGQPLPGAASASPAASAAWTPAPAPAVTEAPSGIPAVTHPQWRPLNPVAEPGPLAGRPLRLQQPAGQGGELTVRPGDSLWSLSAARLGPFASDVDIARDWPRLYQANRDIIGANPHLLLPGQVLRIPPGP
ncbi:MAG: LysM domain-containing protein [Arthrobacter sp.]